MNWPVLGAIVSYACASYMSFRDGNWYWTFIWLFYAAANVLLMMAEYKKGG